MKACLEPAHDPSPTSLPAVKVISVLLLILSGGLVWAGCLGTTQTEALKIGLVAPFEGARRQLGYDVLAAVRIAVREQNEAGGVQGRPILIVALNDEDHAEQARWQAQKMALDPAVMGVLGHWSRETTEAALSIYQEAGLPLVIPTAGDDELGGACAVHIAPMYEELSHVMLDTLAQRARGARVALFVQPAHWQAALAESLQAAGLEILLPTGDGKAVQADLALVSLDYESTARTLEEIQSPAVFLLNDLYWPIIQRLGQSSTSSLWVWTLESSDENTLTRFRETYRHDTGHEPSLQAQLAYDGARLLLHAANAAGTREDRLSRQAICRSLRVDMENGITGPLTFDAAGRRIGLQVRFRPLAELLSE